MKEEIKSITRPFLMDNELKINITESTKARKLKINTAKKDIIKPTEEDQLEISITKQIKNRRKSIVNYIKITDVLKHEINFPDSMKHSKYIPMKHAFGSFYNICQ